MTTSSEELSLDARKAAILEAVVNEYIGTAQPVGSSHVASAAGINVSSATIRAEMAALENEGYLVQPHTSAGRIPTDKGYRFFVDNLASPAQVGPAVQQKIATFFDQVHGEMESMLERSSSLLSDLTSYAAVVVGPTHDRATIRTIQVVSLSGSIALVVAVLADGAVEKVTVDFGTPVDDDTLAALNATVSEAAVGHVLSDLPTIGTTERGAIGAHLATVSAALGSLNARGEGESVFVGGPSKLAASFDAVETVRSVLGILEQQLVVVSLLRDVLSRGLSVSIGQEHGVEPLSSCAVVVAPLLIDGVHAGAVGLLGPTRMDYPAALATASFVGHQLSDRLDGGYGTPPTSGAPARARKDTTRG